MNNTITMDKTQEAACSHLNGPMMVLAGPGSGKTTVITQRTARLIEGHCIPAENILTITYTKAAAEHMKERFHTLTSNKWPGTVFSTFHSFFFNVLRRAEGLAPDAVLGDYERSEALKHLAHGVFGGYVDDDLLKALSSEISLVKNELINIGDYNPMCAGTAEFKRFFRVYEDFKNDNGKIDFDDMLTRTYRLLTSRADILASLRERFGYIMIDEFQDINRAQYECVKLLAKPLDNLFIVGDDDQSIYRFRGARPEFLLSFPKDYPSSKTVTLEVNYRSSDQIIALSSAAITKNERRFVKNQRGLGVRSAAPSLMLSEDVWSEALAIAKKIKALSKKTDYRDIAVIYRTNLQAVPLSEVFFGQGIPFFVKDELPNIYEHWIAKDICAYMALVLDRSDSGALERIINKPARYIKKTVIAEAKRGGLLSNLLGGNLLTKRNTALLEELMYHLNAMRKCPPHDTYKYIRRTIGYDRYLRSFAEYRKTEAGSFFELMDALQESSKPFGTITEYLAYVENAKDTTREINARKDKSLTGVTLTTMHSAKGLEFDSVFVAGAVEGIVPYKKCKTPSELEDERRLLYVAITRARSNLYISATKTRHDEKTVPTSFLKGILYK